MITFIRMLLTGLALLLLAAVIGLFAVRFHDGPVGIVAGGAFTSGTLHQGAEPDWSFVAERPTVEFQLLDPERSRTTWIVEHEGRIYIPCGYMNSTWGRLWKHWPIEAERDGRALLRVDDTLYPRQLVRVTQGRELKPILAKLGNKYLGAAITDSDAVSTEPVTSGDLWLFELQPR